MELQFLGHAGWLATNKNFKALFDPWFNPQGCFFNEWFPFPNNAHLFTPELCCDLDFIYISHPHEDHFDKWFLNHIKKTVPIFIPNFRDKTLLHDLQELGFKTIVEFDDDDAAIVKGILVKIIKLEGYLESDSCILLDDDCSKILNLNDCHIAFSKLKRVIGDVDVLLLQCSNAIWFPCCYEYSEEKMAEHGKNKRQNILNRALKYAKTLNAKKVIPNAGPPIFRSPQHDRWNYSRRDISNPFGLMQDSVKYFHQEGIDASLVIPGSTISLNNNEIVVNSNTEEVANIYDDVDAYTTEYLKEIRSRNIEPPVVSEQELISVVPKFIKHIEKMFKISLFYVEKIKFPVLFDFQDRGRILVDFPKKTISEYVNQPYNYSFTFDPALVAQLFRNKTIDFETYFLSCNFSCKRSPDIYTEALFTLLKHFDIKRFATSERIYGERQSSFEETFEKTHEGKTYKIQKYCPHMFADLEEVGYFALCMDGNSIVKQGNARTKTIFAF